MKRKIVIAGIDALPSGLKALQDGMVNATMFQDTGGRERGAGETALKFIHGGIVFSRICISLKLVTRDGASQFANRNRTGKSGHNGKLG